MIHAQWNIVDSLEDLESLLRNSHESDQLIFKHSSRCGISSLVKNRLAKEINNSVTPITIHLIEVINSRTLSNQLAEHLSVRHESPQLLVISKGKCTFHTSHFDISLKNLPTSKEE